MMMTLATASMALGDDQKDLKTVEANGIRFKYLEAGKGPLVLCLHGFPDTPHTWDDLLPELAKAGYHAVAPYMRGYAPTSKPANGDYSMLALGEDVTALIGALGEQRAIVVAHDWGALAAYMAANAHPEKIEKLVTVAIPQPRAIDPVSLRFFEKSWHFFFYGLTPWIPEALLRKQAGWGSVPWIFERWSPGWKPAPGELAAVKESFAVGVEGPLDYYRAFAKDQVLGGLRLTARARRTREIMFRKTSVPTLTILGRHDGALGLNDPEKTRPCFTGPYTLELMDTGHFVQREKPAEFNARVLAFLGAPPAATPSRGLVGGLDTR
jgi:pimeloyl-ACP methyl ester carboxylesterase